MFELLGDHFKRHLNLPRYPRWYGLVTFTISILALLWSIIHLIRLK
jgi:hypothetical protein